MREYFEISTINILLKLSRDIIKTCLNENINQEAIFKVKA